MAAVDWSVSPNALTKQLLSLSRPKLVKYCKDENVSSVGKKIDIINRLITLKSTTTTTKKKRKSSKKIKRISKNKLSPITMPEANIDRWFLDKTLRKYQHSWTKKGYDHKDKTHVALKFISKTSINYKSCQQKKLQNHIKKLKRIKNKHVEKLIEYNSNTIYTENNQIISSILLVTNTIPHQELYDILYFLPGISEKIIRTYFHQLIDGLAAIRAVGIYYNNINSLQLFLDKKYQLKIGINGGITALFKNQDENDKFGVTRYYAPEIFKNIDKNEYKTAGDIFSCGVILSTLLSGVAPFEKATAECKWYQPLTNGNAKQFWQQHRGSGISIEAKKLIARMLWYDYNERITIEGIRENQWYNNEVFGEAELEIEIKKLRHLMEIQRRKPMDVKSSNERLELLLTGYTKMYYNNGFVKDDGYEFPERVIRLICDYVSLKEYDEEILKSDEFRDVYVAFDGTVNHGVIKNVPKLNENDFVGLNDIYTTYPVKCILYGIQKQVRLLKGACEVHCDGVYLLADLATNEFPGIVSFKIRIFEDVQRECYLVRFERFQGDILHAVNIKKKLLKQCEGFLTGISDKYWNVTQKEMEESEQLYS